MFYFSIYILYIIYVIFQCYNPMHKLVLIREKLLRNWTVRFTICIEIANLENICLYCHRKRFSKFSGYFLVLCWHFSNYFYIFLRANQVLSLLQSNILMIEVYFCSKMHTLQLVMAEIQKHEFQVFFRLFACNFYDIRN